MEENWDCNICDICGAMTESDCEAEIKADGEYKRYADDYYIKAKVKITVLYCENCELYIKRAKFLANQINSLIDEKMKSIESKYHDVERLILSSRNSILKKAKDYVDKRLEEE